MTRLLSSPFANLIEGSLALLRSRNEPPARGAPLAAIDGLSPHERRDIGLAADEPVHASWQLY